MGDRRTDLCLLESGNVKVGAFTPDGKEKIFYLCRAGELFGELAVCGTPRRTEQAVAIERSIVTSVSVPAVIQLLRREPELLLAFLQLLGRKLLALQDQTLALAFDTVPRRLAKELLRLSQLSRGPDEHEAVPLVLSPTHEELAALIGTTREMVTTTMNRFRQMHLVTYQPRSISVAPKRLQEYLEDRPPRMGRPGR